jgi:hypothetical protein
LDLFLDSKIETPGIEVPTHFIDKAQLQRIKNALDLYYIEKGNYPSRLEELITVGLLQKRDLFYRRGSTYKYELKDGKYFLKH